MWLYETFVGSLSGVLARTELLRGYSVAWGEGGSAGDSVFKGRGREFEGFSRVGGLLGRVTGGGSRDAIDRTDSVKVFIISLSFVVWVSSR